uniref:Auxin response factor 18 n=1 Tax=Cajanus cajan TaxID=3821 RepID=A0A151TV40_CAJCA|nr:Auxin response factor 18 [Cajanus cajan]
MLESKEKLKEVDMCLDHELWHACAGGMVQMPVVNAKVFYFPQGHAEHACGPVDFRAYPKIPPFIQCRVGAIKYMADPETDEVDKPPSFAKTLTQSDANNGWSTFVNQKKLVAGDSIVFLRAENGDLCVGIRRAKRGIGGGFETPSVWNSARGIRPMPFGGFSAFLREEDNQLMRNGNSNGNGLSLSPGAKGKVRPEAVIEAATLAANLQDFEVVYYPRASTPEFCVKASLVRAAFQIRWCPGMRFKMPFETEDSSRISWFLGTISSVNFADPRWPDSPWRLLQVTWDEPELLQNVKRVSPWLVEIVSNMPAIHLSPFSPPRKKLRLPQHPEFAFEGQIPFPTFPSNFLGPTNPFGYPPESTTPAGMQGARHDNYGISLPNFHLNNKLHSGLFQSGFPPLDHAASPTLRVSNTPPLQKANTSDNVSCLLSMSTSSQSSKKVNDVKAPHLVLFGQTILTEQQISLSTSADTVSPGKSSPDGNVDKMTNFSDASLETGHCKVFMESEDVGRTMDLSLLGSYDELYRKMADMFGIEKSVVLSHVLYCDITGAVKHIGDEAFSDFTKSARRLTIIMDSSRDNRGI